MMKLAIVTLGCLQQGQSQVHRKAPNYLSSNTPSVDEGQVTEVFSAVSLIRPTSEIRFLENTLKSSAFVMTIVLGSRRVLRVLTRIASPS